MKVFLTGGTGYVGSRILTDLLSAGHEVKALVREGSEEKLPVSRDEIEIVTGDALDKSSFAPSLGDCDAVIHIIGIIREFPWKGITFQKMHVKASENLIDAAIENDVGRFIYMSALGAKLDSKSGYFTTKAQVEDQLRESGLDYTIFKPSIIFGPGDEFINYFADMMKTFHVLPIIGKGKYRMQPVHISNVSQAFVQALTTPESIGKIYEIGGPDRYEYTEMMRRVKSTVGTFALFLHIPKVLMQWMAKLLQSLPFFPVTEAQIIMLYDENITEDNRAWEDFDLDPVGFEEGINRYLGDTE
ncbi:MAG: complex I NDUFA9 subunit family protein [Candidatus Marinimicrobia bacterium]|nr:complex I NDUFA9 subunit family protein [Candidatus Neomarinimicrobiota bacterium]MCF7829033.1 complex I NDUFA9 subunit family protein [Candidatus Neomarinimicrobiota bacterium]MCF7881830.1 complex I NDUFA9 subunit family protein [Candidatus Neomarinimicrobiota bacterium]